MSIPFRPLTPEEFQIALVEADVTVADLSAWTGISVDEIRRYMLRENHPEAALPPHMLALLLGLLTMPHGPYRVSVVAAHLRR